MDSKTQLQRTYTRNSLVCFVCTAVCIIIDVRHFISVGKFYFSWQLGLSFVAYILLIIWGIRNFIKARNLKKESSINQQ